MNDNKIEGLTLILSCGCNLDCSYCLIAQSKNKKSSQIQQNTIQALKDGSFLKNTIYTIEKLGGCSTDIKSIQFWGQEPTLTLDLYTNFLEKWQTSFPNVKEYMFSTNGKAYPEKIINFIKQLDIIANKSINVSIQFSYDGDYGNEQNRGIQSNNILNNLLFIINELNQIKLNYVKVCLYTNGVFSRNIIKNLNSVEKINNFVDRGYDIIQKLVTANNNINVTIGNQLPCSPQVPYGDCTTEDGLDLLNFFNRLQKINNKNFINIFVNSWLRSYKNFLDTIKKYYFNNYNVINLIKMTTNINNNEIQRMDIKQRIGINDFCAPNYSHIKVMYDGTLLECHNAIFDLDPNELKAKNEKHLQIKKNDLKYNKIFNPINASQDEITQFLDNFIFIKEESFWTTYHQVVNLMYLLAQYNQIDSEYLQNPDKLLLHAFIITKIDTCQYNRKYETGSSFFIPTGQIRYFCNGFLSAVIDDQTGDIKEFN